MRRRLFRFQWSLRSLLLLTAAVAVWVDYFKIRREIPRLETRVVSMQEMIGELIVEDPGMIAVVGLPQEWFDENRWSIYLPEGRYRLRLATRQIDRAGLAVPVEESPLDAGRHGIELRQSRRGDRRVITILVDDRPQFEATQSPGWDPGHGSSGGNEVGRCVQLPRDKAVVLFRRRFSHRQPDGSSTTPAGPRDGLLLWIEAISGVRD